MKCLSRRSVLLSSAAVVAAGYVPALAQAAAADTEWRTYGGNLASNRYSPLDQINASNFNKLEVAWRFKHRHSGRRAGIQLRMHAAGGQGRAVSPPPVRAAMWSAWTPPPAKCCGCTAMTKASAAASRRANSGPRRRLLDRRHGGTHPLCHPRLPACSRWTPRPAFPIPASATSGIVDLSQNNDQEIDLVKADIGLHATPFVAGDVVIVGAAHTAGNVPPIASNVKGYVRGFDVKTGKRMWIFHTIPRKGEFGYDTWLKPGQAEAAGNTGVWAPDVRRSGTGPGLSAASSCRPATMMGSHRHGNGLFGESMVAVDIETGKRKWHYQTDPSRPVGPRHSLRRRSCATSRINGKIVKALAQPTKQASSMCWTAPPASRSGRSRKSKVRQGRRAGRMVFADPADPHQAAAPSTSRASRSTT